MPSPRVLYIHGMEGGATAFKANFLRETYGDDFCCIEQSVGVYTFKKRGVLRRLLTNSSFSFFLTTAMSFSLTYKFVTSSENEYVQRKFQTFPIVKSFLLST